MFVAMTVHPPMHTPPPRWRFADGCLIETGPAGRFVYGPWDGDFGCRQERGGPTVTPPPRRWLDHRGVPLPPAGLRDDAWFQSRAALVAYFTAIPLAVRLRAALHADRQWQAFERSHRSFPGSGAVTP